MPNCTQKISLGAHFDTSVGQSLSISVQFCH